VPNRHPVDQLADIRAEIKVLKQREETLRAEVLVASPDDRVGDEHEAMVCETMVERVDLELMKRELGLLFLRPFLREQVVTTVRLKPKQTKNTPRTT
jgi:hypothetical protein